MDEEEIEVKEEVPETPEERDNIIKLRLDIERTVGEIVSALKGRILIKIKTEKGYKTIKLKGKKLLDDEAIQDLATYLRLMLNEHLTLSNLSIQHIVWIYRKLSIAIANWILQNAFRRNIPYENWWPIYSTVTSHIFALLMRSFGGFETRAQTVIERVQVIRKEEAKEQKEESFKLLPFLFKK